MTSSRPTQMDQQSGRSSGEMQESNCGLSVGRSSSEDLPPALSESAVLHRMKYHFFKADPADPNDVDDWELFDADIDCSAGCIDVLVVRAEAFAALLAAAQCAANVLFLLQDEVKALGCNAKNVPQQLRAAIALATKEKS